MEVQNYSFGEIRENIRDENNRRKDFLVMVDVSHKGIKGEEVKHLNHIFKNIRNSFISKLWTGAILKFSNVVLWSINR